MSESLPSSAAPTPSALPLDKAGPPVRLPRLLTGLALAAGFFDLCFWQVKAPGLSVGVFFAALSGIILGNRESGGDWRRSRLLIVLLAGAVLAAVIETGATNFLVLLFLIVALAGETFFSGIVSAWGRGLSQVVALALAPGRVFWLGARLMEAAFASGGGWTGGLIGGCLLAIPAILLALVFGSLLATGNAVFGNWTSNFFDWFWKEVALYLDPARIFFWVVAAFVILPLLRPAQVSAWWWKWTENLPRFPEFLPAGRALFSSALVLVVLNLLFLVANIADGVFLWGGRGVPAGVTYSDFVHHGVNTLIVTVILSAIVLVTIFQQSFSVTSSRVLKLLGLFWVAQNLFLLLSVTLRLKLYIEAYNMSVLRLSLMIFLVLVAVGFGLLVIKIVREKSLSRLVGGCVLAVFMTFYVTQFLNLAGWSADYNMAQWQKDPRRSLDGNYLEQLGPAAWPAIARGAYGGDDISPDARSAWHAVNGDEKNIPKAEFDLAHWREFSLRAHLNRWALEQKPNN